MIPADSIGADIVQDLGMLNVEGSHLAPAKVYRSLRSKPRYDIELDKGWSEYITNVAPIRIVEPPSSNSATGRIITFSEEILDDVDVSPFSLYFRVIVKLISIGDHIRHRIRSSI